MSSIPSTTQNEAGSWRLGSRTGRHGKPTITWRLSWVATRRLRRKERRCDAQTVCGFTFARDRAQFSLDPRGRDQRLVRAKRKDQGIGLAFEIPEGSRLGERCAGYERDLSADSRRLYRSRRRDAHGAETVRGGAVRLAHASQPNTPPPRPAETTRARTSCVSFMRRAGAARRWSGAMGWRARQDRSRWAHALIAQGRGSDLRGRCVHRGSRRHTRGIASVHAGRAAREPTGRRRHALRHACSSSKPTAVVRLNAALGVRVYAMGPATGLTKLVRSRARAAVTHNVCTTPGGICLAEGFGARRATPADSLSAAFECPVLNGAERDYLRAGTRLRGARNGDPRAGC